MAGAIDVRARSIALLAVAQVGRGVVSALGVRVIRPVCYTRVGSRIPEAMKIWVRFWVLKIKGADVIMFPARHIGGY